MSERERERKEANKSDYEMRGYEGEDDFDTAFVKRRISGENIIGCLI